DELDVGMSTSPLGSGGMRSKVVAAEMATAAGIPAVIANGTRPGTVLRALRGESEGTRFHPQEQRVSSFKLWLKYAKPSRGRIVVDRGAEAALRERGTSLLAGGVAGVHGDIQAGGAVRVATVAGDGTGMGKGIATYAATELGLVMAMKAAG